MNNSSTYINRKLRSTPGIHSSKTPTRSRSACVKYSKCYNGMRLVIDSNKVFVDDGDDNTLIAKKFEKRVLKRTTSNCSSTGSSCSSTSSSNEDLLTSDSAVNDRDKKCQMINFKTKGGHGGSNSYYPDDISIILGVMVIATIIFYSSCVMSLINESNKNSKLFVSSFSLNDNHYHHRYHHIDRNCHQLQLLQSPSSQRLSKLPSSLLTSSSSLVESVANNFEETTTNKRRGWMRRRTNNSNNSQQNNSDSTNNSKDVIIKFVSKKTVDTPSIPLISGDNDRKNDIELLTKYFTNDSNRNLLFTKMDLKTMTLSKSTNVNMELYNKWSLEAALGDGGISSFGMHPNEYNNTIIQTTTSLRMGPGLHIITQNLIGVKLLVPTMSSTTCTDDNGFLYPEYQFTLLESKLIPSGPKPLVWLFNQLIKYRDTTSSFTRVHVVTDSGGSSIKFVTDARLETSIRIPKIALRLIPGVNVERFERQGTESLQNLLENELKPALLLFYNEFRKYYYQEQNRFNHKNSKSNNNRNSQYLEQQQV